MKLRTVASLFNILQLSINSAWTVSTAVGLAQTPTVLKRVRALAGRVDAMHIAMIRQCLHARERYQKGTYRLSFVSLSNMPLLTTLNNL